MIFMMSVIARSVCLHGVIARSRRRRSNLLLYLIFLLFSVNPVWAAAPQVCHQNNCVAVEVVSKSEDMQRGLMYRKELKKDQGMLFVFDDDGRHKFWMKNMKFDLDMVWINHEGKVVFIGQNISACKTDRCPLYACETLSRYVLELNSGYTASHGWKVGDHLFLGL